MDINSLLSPSESTRTASSTPSSPQPSPFKYVQRTQSGPGLLKHGHASSPLSQSVMNQSSIPAHVLSPSPHQASSPLISPIPATNSSHLARSISAQSIESIAELSSGHSQGARTTAGHGKIGDGHETSQSPVFHTVVATAGLTSNPRASFDINMLETPKQNTRTDFSTTSLPAEKQSQLSKLMKDVLDNPSTFDSHVEIINLLHQGFIDHIYPPSESNTRRDPHSYDLLHELRTARESMEKLFAIGEKLWVDWLQDESILARTAEERIAVVESCRRAVDEEMGSILLWTTYGDWVRHCYEWASETSVESEMEEERKIGQELFTWQLVMETWQEAVDQTKFNLVQSHLIWSKYIAIQKPQSDQKLNKTQRSAVLDSFQQRLQTPHAKWDETFQAFSSFVSMNFDPDEYEQIMSDMLRSATVAKQKWTARESFESGIEQAQQGGDRLAEYTAFMQYLDWEQKPERRRKVDAKLTNELFQRMELAFPSTTAIWEDHVTFLLENSTSIPLRLLERACKHCPWSGSLWSQYLLSSDRAGQLFHETENIKHKATSTGLLEAAGIEEVIKVHSAWCSFLRRRSFRPDGNEEDVDVAEMGIRSSIENVASLAATLGLVDVADPSFRLQRIYVGFLSESGRWDNARQEFDNAVRDYGRYWEFWMLFYHWEMGRWRRFAVNHTDSSDTLLGNLSPPHLATAVLKEALDQQKLEYPEPIMQALITHCEDYEDAEEIQAAMTKVRKVQKMIEIRRQAEVLQNAEAKAEADVTGHVANQTASDMSPSTKRKWEEDDEKSTNKRSRNEDIPPVISNDSDSTQPRRDRENAVVLVENLPENISESRVRQYFSHCGPVRTVKVSREEDVSALVEFEDDDSARYSLSRDEQELDGSIITVTLHSRATIFLTNYKPSADENYIRQLLQSYGDIVSVRFPSLQGNKKRRFCYVQFKQSDEAQAASAGLDGRTVDNHVLVCKISDPLHRQTRKDNHSDNERTIFVGQLNFKATEADLRSLLAERGVIEKVAMPMHATLKGRNRGVAYVTFESVGDAEKALALFDGYEFQGRSLTVNHARDRQVGSRRNELSERSTTPTHNGPQSVSSDIVDTTNHRDCLVFLGGVPDTVNEARIRELASSFGTVERVILKTNHQGAIIQYSQPSQAGQASLKLDHQEIDPGRQIRVVTEAELRSSGREKKTEEVERVKPKIAKSIGATAPIKRPQQPGTKKRGNLGQRSLQRGSNAPAQTAQVNGNEVKKSNAEFKAMLMRKETSNS